MSRSGIVLALALFATTTVFAGEGDSRWKRPLRAEELWPTVAELLGLTPSELGPVPNLPPLPLERGIAVNNADGFKFAAWNVVSTRVADLVIDPRLERPPVRRFRFVLGDRGIAAEQVSGPPQADAIAKVALADPLAAKAWPAGWAVVGGVKGPAAVAIAGPVIAEAGVWRISVRAARGAVPVAASARNRPARISLAVDGRILTTVDLDGGEGVFQVIEANAALRGGVRVQVNIGEADAIANPKLPTAELWISEIELEGPLFDEFAGWPHPAQRRLLDPDPPPIAKSKDPKTQPKSPPLSELEQLTRLLRRAFRRPPTQAEIDSYTKVLAAGQGPAAWTPVVRAVLADPAFLYLENHTQVKPGTPAPLTPYELAARLSYAFRGVPPDDELLNLAAAGDVVPANFVRGPKVNLSARLGSRWLGLENLASLPVDRTLHPEWDAEFIQSLSTEIAATFQRLTVNNQAKIADLLGGPAVMANPRLARFYDLFGVEDNLFRPLASSPTHGRAGLITTGAVLSLSSGGTKAGLPNRARWIADRFFVDLPATDIDELSGLLACYDGIGRWNIPLTAEKPLKDVSALRTWLAKRQDSFQRRLNRELIFFTVGYAPPAGDLSADAIAIDRTVEKNNNNPPTEWTRLLRGLVSHPTIGQKW